MVTNNDPVPLLQTWFASLIVVWRRLSKSWTASSMQREKMRLFHEQTQVEV